MSEGMGVFFIAFELVAHLNEFAIIVHESYMKGACSQWIYVIPVQVNQHTQSSSSWSVWENDLIPRSRGKYKWSISWVNVAFATLWMSIWMAAFAMSRPHSLHYHLRDGGTGNLWLFTFCAPRMVLFQGGGECNTPFLTPKPYGCSV